MLEKIRMFMKQNKVALRYLNATAGSLYGSRAVHDYSLWEI